MSLPQPVGSPPASPMVTGLLGGDSSPGDAGQEQSHRTLLGAGSRLWGNLRRKQLWEDIEGDPQAPSPASREGKTKLFCNQATDQNTSNFCSAAATSPGSPLVPHSAKDPRTSHSSQASFFLGKLYRNTVPCLIISRADSNES